MLQLVSFVLLVLISLPAIAAQQIKTMLELQSSPALELIEYALAVTQQEYGPATLVFMEQMTQGRVEQLVRVGEVLHLAAFAPDVEREKALLPLYFPLTRGLLGYRVCLIKQGQQSKFNRIRSLDDWRRAGLLIGQGANWPDVEVLRANNLVVTTNPIPSLLFNMLRQQRFDCFARGINEVGYELTLPVAAGLVLEKNLLLFYSQPLLLFVAPNQPALAKRLQIGLERAWKDGFMQQHFAQYYGPYVNQLRCEKRQLLMLENPLLSAKARQAMAKYAITPEQLFAVAGENCAPY